MLPTFNKKQNKKCQQTKGGPYIGRIMRCALSWASDHTFGISRIRVCHALIFVLLSFYFGFC